MADKHVLVGKRKVPKTGGVKKKLLLKFSNFGENFFSNFIGSQCSEYLPIFLLFLQQNTKRKLQRNWGALAKHRDFVYG